MWNHRFINRRIIHWTISYQDFTQGLNFSQSLPQVQLRICINFWDSMVSMNKMFRKLISGCRIFLFWRGLYYFFTMNFKLNKLLDMFCSPYSSHVLPVFRVWFFWNGTSYFKTRIVDRELLRHTVVLHLSQM